jgi:MFS superfamily sulfate permease-like transporter
VFVVNDKNNYLFRLRKDVSFLNKAILKSKIEEVPSNSFVYIDTSPADFIDKDITEVINDFLKHAHLKNIKIEIKKSIQKPVHMLFEIDHVVPENIVERSNVYKKESVS